MHVSEFEELIEKHSDNVAKIYQLATGKSLEEYPPLGLIDTLKAKLTDIEVNGVCYNDVMFLKSRHELDSITGELNPNDFSHEPVLAGVTKVSKIIKVAVAILEKGNK